MSTLEALYFPNTKINSAGRFPAFLAFDIIHLLEPVETDGEDGTTTPDSFISAGLCQAHTPCPLGEQRDRFLHLVRDIRERKDDYAAQLSALTLAALSEKKPSVDDSSASIMTNLLGGTPEKDPQEAIDLELWQARLTLKIGELLDSEEEEVAKQLALLEDDEEGLFKTLQGEMDEEEETLFAELQQLRNTMNKPSVTAVIKRLKAWARLFAAGESPVPKIFLTHMEEAADRLLEEYEERTALSPKTILELALPANIGWNAEKAGEAITTFKATNDEVLKQLGRYLASPASDDNRTALEQRWADALDKPFPSTETGRVRLVFYGLPSLSCSTLMEKKSTEGGDILAVVRWLE